MFGHLRPGIEYVQNRTHMTEMHRPALLYCRMRQEPLQPTALPVSERASSVRSVTTTQGN